MLEVAALVIYGLWQSAGWGWWFGLALWGVLALLGTIGLVALLGAGALEGRPYPSVDILVMAISIGVLGSDFGRLLSPRGRAQVRQGK